MRRAVQYIRVSSEQQKHSLAAQSAQIAEFAMRHGYHIVRSYEDRGHSGLHLKGRAALQSLLVDVLSPERGFDAVLVQDVSRWGRFQDSDEAAHYEYLCRAAGVAVRYCDEPFDEMEGRSGDLIKAVKRLMAADFSRELSGKVRASQYRYAQAGYKMGGVAGYGLRRAVVDAQGQVTAILEFGQQRLLRGERVIFVPGPDYEVETVRRIFEMFLEGGLGLKAIAEILNAENVAGEGARPWSAWTVGNLLENPKYAGTYRFGRRRRTLDGRRLNNAPECWLRVEGAFASLVPGEWLKAAAAKRRHRMLFLSPEEIWRRLGEHAAQTGRLERAAVQASEALPSPRTCSAHFGPWRRISARLGLYPPILPGRIDRRSRAGDRADRNAQEPSMPRTYTAFVGATRLATGDLETVALAAHAVQDRQTEMPIVFADATGSVVDLDLRGSPQDVVKRLQASQTDVTTDAQVDGPRPRGRPKLGVTAREITLLPKHWTWLQEQPGGASATLRRLVEQAQQDNAEADERRRSQTATYKVMYALGGHLAGYENALRALYAGDAQRFESQIKAWPADISGYVRDLAEPSFGH